MKVEALSVNNSRNCRGLNVVGFGLNKPPAIGVHEFKTEKSKALGMGIQASLAALFAAIVWFYITARGK